MVRGLLEITGVLTLDGNLMLYCILMIKVDGLSLLTACLKHWLSAGNHCPKVLVSTHFHSIIQQKLLPLTSLLSFQVRKLLYKATVIRDVTRTLIGGGGGGGGRGCIFIYSCSARRASFQVKFKLLNLK